METTLQVHFREDSCLPDFVQQVIDAGQGKRVSYGYSIQISEVHAKTPRAVFLRHEQHRGSPRGGGWAYPALLDQNYHLVFHLITLRLRKAVRFYVRRLSVFLQPNGVADRWVLLHSLCFFEHARKLRHQGGNLGRR